MSYRRWFAASLVCASLFSQNLVHAAEVKTAVLSQLFQSVMFLPVYVAMDQGFFDKNGLSVKKQTAGSPNVALSAVIAGSADFSLHGPEWTAIAASKGAPVQIVASVVNRAAIWIAAQPGFKYEKPTDFGGQTVVSGMMPIASTSLFNKLLKDNQLDKDSAGIRNLQVQPGSELGPFLAGQAAAAVLYEPALDQAVARGMKIIHSFPQQYGPYLLAAISVRKDQDPDKVQRFVSGLNQAMRFMHANPDVTIDIAKREFPNVDAKVVEAAVRRMLNEQVYPQSVEVERKALTVAMETQISLGNLKEQPRFEDFVGDIYIRRALAQKR